MAGWRRIAGWLAVLLAVSCGGEAPVAAELIVLVRAGDLDPLTFPGTAGRVELLLLEIDNELGGAEIAFRVDEGPSFTDRRIPLEPAATTQLRLSSTDQRDGSLFSVGRSAMFDVVPGDTIAASVFMAPLGSPTPVGRAVPSRAFPAAARLGEHDVLITGGDAVVELYRHDEARLCDDCLSGDAVPRRAGGIAVRLSSGDVLHGFGTLTDNGSPDAALFLTDPSTATTELTVTGFIPTNGAPGAMVIPRGDGAIMIAATDTPQVHDISVAGNTVTIGPSEIALGAVRQNAAALVLADGRTLIVGGDNSSGSELGAEIINTDGTSELASGTMSGPRVRATLVEIDQHVIIAGGGTPGLDIFSVATSTVLAAEQPSVPAYVQAADFQGDVLLLGDGYLGFLTSIGSVRTLIDLGVDAAIDHQLVRLADGAVLSVGGDRLKVIVPE